MRTVWERITATQPLPDPGLVLVAGLVALALVALPETWRWVRLGVTVVHEAGHAVVAVLVGRRLQGIRLHRDTSGLTVSKGRPAGPGMVAMLAAGYLAPAVVGVTAALLLAEGRAVALLWLAVVLLLALLVWVRNAYGAVTLLAFGAAVGLLTWYADPAVQSLAAYLVAWLLLLAAPRPLLELLAAGRHGRRGSDPDQLARLTRVPAVAWCLVMLAANLTGLTVGAALLAPDLLARVG
ncbi:M50 family metallopeptidase [Nocardioides litoris]|uniref:M50 family metallopeptidase n=1 Tax=Nocardioides litoris TaxID=1926648 RepID=UPI001120C8FD|nr:M50 family metallopeptidase [Nocardioides litoris]